MHRRFGGFWFLPAIIVARCLGPICACAQISTSIPDPSHLPFSWGQLAPATTVAILNVHAYVNPDGSANGSVTDVSHDVQDLRPVGAGAGSQTIGTARWQYVLFKSSTGGPFGSITDVGAALMGGFQQTGASLNPAIHFSFLQIYTDSSTPGGAIDGGGPLGKVNQDIPRWNQNPGWNFDGAQTRNDYFDIAFDSIDRNPETVSFETSLVACQATSALILDDITWSFTANVGGPGNLTGAAPAVQPQASNTLLQLYRNEFPQVTYINEGQGSIQDLPEPGMGTTFALFGAALLNRRRPSSSSNRLNQKYARLT